MSARPGADRGTTQAREECMNTNPPPGDNSGLDRAPELGITKYLRDASRLFTFPYVTNDGDWLTSEHVRWTGGAA